MNLLSIINTFPFRSQPTFDSARGTTCSVGSYVAISRYLVRLQSSGEASEGFRLQEYTTLQKYDRLHPQRVAI